MTDRLDNGKYSTKETVTIKMPYNLPYQDEDRTFERMHGDFQFHGEFYKLVKQKVEKDTLYIICIKDDKEKKIFNLISDIVKISTDFPITPSTLKFLNSLIKDYVASEFVSIASHRTWCSDFRFPGQHLNLLTRSFSVFSPPPELFS